MPKVACERRRRAGEISSPPLLHVRLNARMYAAISTRGRHRSHCEFDCLLHAWASTQGTVNRQLDDAQGRRGRCNQAIGADHVGGDGAGVRNASATHERGLPCRCAIRGRSGVQ